MKGHFRWILPIAAMLLLLLAIACGSQEEDTITVKEERVTQGAPTEEVLPVNNCAGDRELHQDVLASKQYLHDVTVFPVGGKKINAGNIQAAVRDYYKVERVAESAICSVAVSVPAGTFYTYEIEWSETYREGVVEVGADDVDPEASYKFLENIACQLVGIETLACP